MANATVLVAEDDDLIRSIFAEIIKTEGFDVLQAENGEKALQLMTANKVDMLITDMKMPVMNGYDLLVSVKGKHPEMPVVVITGFNSEYKEQDAMAAGADAYITKPFKLTDVATTLRAMYGKVAVGRTA